jgi:hypothetical protein
MKLSILVQTSHFRGDHASDQCIAIEQKPDETVEQLVKRASLGENKYAGQGEVIEIRLIHEKI